MNPKQIEAVLSLSGPERFEHFVKVVADREKAWGLYEDGWALASTDDGVAVFPLWPAAEYAQLCAKSQWGSYSPKAISIEDLLSELLPRLEREGALPGVFCTPEDKGVTPQVSELRRALEAELSRF